MIAGELGTTHVPAVRPVRLVDTTAAGDALAGAYLAARAAERDPRAAPELAMRAAAIVIAHPGAQAPREVPLTRDGPDQRGIPALYSPAVAKRSDRRARRQGAAGGSTGPAPKGSEPAPAAYRTRQFWLGVLAAACLLVPAAVGAAAIAGGGDDEPGGAARAGAPESPEESVRREVERLQKATQTRDKEQVKELTDRARGFAGDLGPIVDGVARTLPPDSEKVGPLAPAADVRDWSRRARAARSYFRETVSGETGTNVARGALAVAVSSLGEVVETYRLALEDPSHRAALLERVRGQRDVAMRAWETGTVQLDAINIAVGYGHQHVAALGAGGLPPDDLPEGTGATEEPAQSASP